MSKRAKIGIWVTWIVGFPSGLWIVYNLFGANIAGHYFEVFLLLLLGMILSFLPIRIAGTDIFMIEAVQLAVFLKFGLFIEIVVMQLSFFAFLSYLKVFDKENVHRIPLNLMMFFVVSVFAALVYYGLGGETGTEATYPDAIPVIGYVATVFISNQLLLYLIKLVLEHKRETLFSKEKLGEIVTLILVLPVGLILYTLLTQVGTVGIFYVAIPLISLSAVLRLYYSTRKINQLLQKTSEIGQQLSERLKVSDTLDFFVDKIAVLLPVDFGYILSTGEKDDLKIVRLLETEKGVLSKSADFKKQEGISGEVWATGNSVCYMSRKQWESISTGFLPPTVQSVISVPMRRNHEIVGIITLASKRKRAYERHELMIIEVLANFLAISIENARNYEKTKYDSERDPLTHLFNYRYFTTMLESMFTDLEQRKTSCFSIILLDLDNFKRVNDTYGHESGNEVLRQLADRLVQLIDNRGTVARYGGEEFVILLPCTDETVCYSIAEEVRDLVSSEPFTILHPLKGEIKENIYVTASIGIAVAPLQGEDALSLIRNADRAMYTGAKQKGKNRVAKYSG